MSFLSTYILSFFMSIYLTNIYIFFMYLSIHPFSFNTLCIYIIYIYRCRFQIYEHSRQNIFVFSKCEIIFGTLSICIFFQYCDSNIRLFSIAPHLVIALPTLRIVTEIYLLSPLRARKSDSYRYHNGRAITIEREIKGRSKEIIPKIKNR